jgi:hypothetical protein
MRKSEKQMLIRPLQARIKELEEALDFVINKCPLYIDPANFSAIKTVPDLVYGEITIKKKDHDRLKELLDKPIPHHAVMMVISGQDQEGIKVKLEDHWGMPWGKDGN